MGPPKKASPKHKSVLLYNVTLISWREQEKLSRKKYTRDKAPYLDDNSKIKNLFK